MKSPIQLFKLLCLCTILLLTFNVQAYSTKTIEANEIIRLIDDNRDVILEDVTIVGDLDFSQLKDKSRGGSYGVQGGSVKEYIGTVSAQLTFINCKFEGNVLTYSETKIGRLIKHNFVNFQQDFTFENCTFNGAVDIEKTQIHGRFALINSNFNKRLRFYRVKFESVPNFYGNNLKSIFKNKNTNWDGEQRALIQPKESDSRNMVVLELKNSTLKDIDISFGKERWTLSPLGTSSLNLPVGEKLYIIENGNQERLVLQADKAMNGKVIDLAKF